jgi:hypothetical protein
MHELAISLFIFFLLIGWLLFLVYRETEQDLPPHNYHRH